MGFIYRFIFLEISRPGMPVLVNSNEGKRHLVAE